MKKGWCHAPPKDQYPIWMDVPHYMLCKNGPQRDRQSSRSREGHVPVRELRWPNRPIILETKAILFFNSILLGFSPRSLLLHHVLIVHSKPSCEKKMKRKEEIGNDCMLHRWTLWSEVNSWERVSYDVFKNLDLNNKKYIYKMQYDSNYIFP